MFASIFGSAIAHIIVCAEGEMDDTVLVDRELRLLGLIGRCSLGNQQTSSCAGLNYNCFDRLARCFSFPFLCLQL
jgi:hypothetical protein